MEGVRSEASGGNRSEERDNDGEECRTKRVVVKSYDEVRADNMKRNAEKLVELFGPAKVIAKRPKRVLEGPAATQGGSRKSVRLSKEATEELTEIDEPQTSELSPLECMFCGWKTEKSSRLIMQNFLSHHVETSAACIEMRREGSTSVVLSSKRLLLNP